MTSEQIEYIRANKDSKTVVEIAQALRKGAATIYAYFTANKWTPYKKPDGLKRHAGHPFRAQNKKLEAYHAARQVQRNAGE